MAWSEVIVVVGALSPLVLGLIKYIISNLDKLNKGAKAYEIIIRLRQEFDETKIMIESHSTHLGNQDKRITRLEKRRDKL